MAEYDRVADPGKMNELVYLRELIFSPELIQQFINAQMAIYMTDKSYFRLVIDPTLKRKIFDQNDILVTFLLHINTAIRGFQREMNDNFREVIEEYTEYEVKRWSFNKRKFQFRIIFGKIVNITIKHLYTGENNVYQYVRYKIDIMNAI